MEICEETIRMILMKHYSIHEVDTLIALLDVDIYEGLRGVLIDDYLRHIRLHSEEDTDETYRKHLDDIVGKLPESPLGTIGCISIRWWGVPCPCGSLTRFLSQCHEKERYSNSRCLRQKRL